MLNVRQDVIDRHLRPILKELLSQCTSVQQAFFKKMYPVGVNEISSEKIPWAISQCERTIKENIAKARKVHNRRPAQS